MEGYPRNDDVVLFIDKWRCVYKNNIPVWIVLSAMLEEYKGRALHGYSLRIPLENWPI